MLDLELVMEERCSSEAALLYPVNAVRNRALMNVKTEVRWEHAGFAGASLWLLWLCFELGQPPLHVCPLHVWRAQQERKL